MFTRAAMMARWSFMSRRSTIRGKSCGKKETVWYLTGAFHEEPMQQTLIVPGRYTGREFIPDGPLPDAEGPAELIITPLPTRAHGSIADAFDKASVLRNGDDILAEARAERDEWGDR